MSKPRVLIVENSIDFTGALNSIVRSCGELSDSFEFNFVVPKGSKTIPYIKSLGLTVHVLPMKEIRKEWTAIISYLPVLLVNSFRFGRLLKRLSVDVVLCNDFYNLIPSIYKMFGGQVPYICYVRFRPSKFPTPLVKFWCWFHDRFAAKIVAVSNTVKRELPQQSAVIVIGNEVPIDRIAFTPSVSETILYPANYIRGKGHEFALRTFAILSRKYPNWKMKFVGSDMGLQKNSHFKRELIEEASNLGISHVVEWGNFQKEMSSQYLEAAIVLNFSESESFSLTCLEAMFYGRPVVATKSGGPEEIIDEGESGLLVNLSDVEGMVSAVDSLISNPERREQLGRTAFERIRKKCSYENTVGKLKTAYNSALSNQLLK
jgi:glycosyltransferase involved in cell wall biosynthesis